MESIHGHDVMHMIADAARPFTRDELLVEISNKFGESARFHTCSAENMTASELVDFLADRGKIQGGESAMKVDAADICQH
jgi:probable metal-binding protein